MSFTKRIGFATVTVLLVLVAVEGVARVIWWNLASQAFALTRQRGQELMQEGQLASIHFMIEPHGLYTYTLKPGFERNGTVVNAQGFAQRETVPRERTPRVLRFAALGESTTQGHHVDIGSYPTYLRKVLETHAVGFKGVESINGGVAGWISDQVALRVENEIAAFQPDIAILYCGWNDFVSYEPYGFVGEKSAFEQAMGGSKFHTQAACYFKSVALLSALYQKKVTKPWKEKPVSQSQGAAANNSYKHYLRSLDRIVVALRHENPRIRIAICTLVGRWPYGSANEFRASTGRTWWMKSHGLSPQEAQSKLCVFNDVIRHYAGDHDLLLIDAAAEFENLDRSRLQWDFAHMHFEGYELLAEVMYEGLRQAGIVSGDKRARRDALLAKYQAATPVASVTRYSMGEE